MATRSTERVRISCTLVQLQQPVQLAVRIFSLGGQRVRTLFTGARGERLFCLGMGRARRQRQPGARGALPSPK